MDLPVDVLQLIFDELVGDASTLARVGLVSRSWRTLSLPFFLKRVDLSSHNDDRLPEHENPSGVVMADDSDEHRPRNLVPRQRAFLRLMADHPELTRHVKAFTWTLMWVDLDEDSLTDIDLHTWDVFSHMRNVVSLDLASLHKISDQPYVRQNPATLFPAVTSLRLVGWMHRGLVKAIVTSLDASRLTSLELDHLQDEGALPNGEPMPEDLARKHAHNHGDPYRDEGIGDELWARQERGDAAIFPGFMWLPLRLLRQRCLASMTRLRIRLNPFTSIRDVRNDITLFDETAKYIRSAKDTLRSVSISLGELPGLHGRGGELESSDRVTRFILQHTYLPMCFNRTSAFLHQLLPLLTEEQFPQLARVDLEGFRVLLKAGLQLATLPNSELTWQYINKCPFVDEGFMKTANLDFDRPFFGYDYNLPGMDQDELDKLERILETS